MYILFDLRRRAKIFWSSRTKVTHWEGELLVDVGGE